MLLLTARPEKYTGLAISLVLHAVVTTCVLFLGQETIFETPYEDAIEVDIVSMPEITAPSMTTPPRSVPAERSQWVEQPVEVAPKAPSVRTLSGPTKAERILSETILGEPKNRQMRTVMAKLASDEQSRQLCNIEAIAQVALHEPALHPDSVVAYAMKSLTYQENAIVAEGAAIHADDTWLTLTFRCELAANRARVKAFEFTLGDPIPRQKWASFNLPVIAARTKMLDE